MTTRVAVSALTGTYVSPGPGGVLIIVGQNPSTGTCKKLLTSVLCLNL